MATQSSALAWITLCTEKPGGPQFKGLQSWTRPSMLAHEVALTASGIKAIGNCLNVQFVAVSLIHIQFPGKGLPGKKSESSDFASKITCALSCFRGDWLCSRLHPHRQEEVRHAFSEPSRYPPSMA